MKKLTSCNTIKHALNYINDAEVIVGHVQQAISWSIQSFMVSPFLIGVTLTNGSCNQVKMTLVIEFSLNVGWSSVIAICSVWTDFRCVSSKYEILCCLILYIYRKSWGDLTSKVLTFHDTILYDIFQMVTHPWFSSPHSSPLIPQPRNSTMFGRD